MCPLVKKWQFDEHEAKPDIHHREWGWADEQGWKHSIYIPYSRANWIDIPENPILDVGEPGAWDDAEVQVADVVYVNRTFYLYYFAHNGTGWVYSKIGLATSKDGISFTKYANNPIITPPGTYTGVQHGAVLYDVKETDPSNRWKFFASLTGGEAGTTPPWHLGYWTSPDGISWTYKGTLTPPNYSRCPAIFRMGNAYWLFYDDRNIGNAEIRLAVTRGFYLWYDGGVVIPLGAAGEWDAVQLAYAGLFWNLGVWYLGYSGHDGTSFRIGMATSSDGFTFTKYPMNPIQDLGPAGSWYDLHIVRPAWLMMEDQFIMFASGNDGTRFRIGRFNLFP